MKKIIRLATVPISLNILIKGQLSFLNKYFDIIAVASGGPELEEVELREGVKTYSVNMERKISLVKDLISLFKLYYLFKKEKPSVVHSMTPKAGLLTMVAAKFAAVPIRMHTFTGLIFPSKSGIIQYILIIMDKILCACATNIYPEGNGVLNDLKKYKITSKPLKVIANGNVNGIDLNYFSIEQVDIKLQIELRKEFEITDDNFVFVFIGRLVGDKGINELVEAFKKMDNGYHNIKLILVGTFEQNIDPLSDKTMQEIESNKNIIAPGFKKDVRPYLAISNALVFPSYREGFPNVVMQAGAMGLPSIVSDINGSNEIVIDNINGIIVPVKNIEAIEQSMKKFIESREFYQLLKNNSRKMISDRYEQGFVWESLLDEYENLLEKQDANI
jgi:glycosyltransferase involved in cell wall biosynthesis